MMRRYFTWMTVVLLVLMMAIGRGWIGPGVRSIGEGHQPVQHTDPMPAAPKGLENYYDQAMTWIACDSGFECATVEVPLDYSHPDGTSITLSLERLTTAHPVGSLVVNPGGPGGSGLQYVRAAKRIMSQKVLDTFDVVGFDPRGVGKSAPVKCLTDRQMDRYVAADGSPDTQAEVSDTIDIVKSFAKGCATMSPQIYSHIDTVSAARDLDIIRDALGDTKLNWFGKSYGTFLGITYADLFPDHVGRMMLDGAIDPTLTNEQMSLGQALGFETALDRFLADCSTHRDCGVDKNPAKAKAQVIALLNKLDRKPARLGDGRKFTQALAITGIVGNLYDKQYGWTDLRGALGDALAGDYELLAASADFYTGRQDDGHYSDNSNDAIMAVNCLDRPDRDSAAATQKLADSWSVKAPVFGAYLAWSNLGCTYWPVPATGTPHKINAKGAPTILVIGTSFDPATPYAWAQATASQLRSGVLLTLHGDGHTAYFTGSPCIDKAVDGYLLTGKVGSSIVCNDAP